MPGSVFAFLNGFGQQGWADMSIMNIEVLAGGKRYRFQSEAGTSLKDCLLKAGILEGAECGGRGICGKCAVKVRSGTLAPVEGDESFLMTRGDGKVLACQSLIDQGSAAGSRRCWSAPRWRASCRAAPLRFRAPDTWRLPWRCGACPRGQVPMSPRSPPRTATASRS